MIIHDTLAMLGLSQNETDVYLALNQRGPSSIREVAAAASLNRGTTYEILKRLRDRGLASYAPRGKRRYFCAEPPETLIRLADERFEAMSRARTDLVEQIVPDLRVRVPHAADTDVRHYEGDDGIEFVLRDILATVGNQPERHYRVYSSRLIRKYLYRPFPTFTRQRVERNIRVSVIAIGEGGDDAPLAERKWLPASPDETSASYVAIYPPKCAFISLVNSDYPTAVILDSDAVATSQKLAFDTLWDRL